MLLAWAIISTLLLVAAVWYGVHVTKQNLQLNDQKEDLVDQIEESLDTLDQCYARLAHHADIPVLSDEPIIQDVVYDMKRARNAVLKVASLIVTYGGEGKEEAES
jgi:type II secretory pathway component PulJ